MQPFLFFLLRLWLRNFFFDHHFSLHCIGQYCFHSSLQPLAIHTTSFIVAYIGFSNRFSFIASEIGGLIFCDNHVHLNPLINFTWMTWSNLYLMALTSFISLYQISLLLDPPTPLSIRTLFSLSLHLCRLFDSDGRKLRGCLVDTDDRKSTEA